MGQSIDSIYTIYFNDIYRFLLSLCKNHHTAEDLLQETFLRAYLHVEQNHVGSIKSWLFTVAYHAFIDHQRKQRRIDLDKGNFLEKLLDHKKTPEEKIMMDEQVQMVIEQLDSMPKKQKLAVLLHDFHELSYKEAADVMGISLASFKVSLYRARQAIREKRGRNK